MNGLFTITSAIILSCNRHGTKTSGLDIWTRALRNDLKPYKTVWNLKIYDVELCTFVSEKTKRKKRKKEDRIKQ
jgi:hypothetical protein